MARRRPDRDFVERRPESHVRGDAAVQLTLPPHRRRAKGVVEKGEVEVANGEFKLTRDLVAGENRVE